MDEFGLEEAKLEGADWLVEFSRHPRTAKTTLVLDSGGAKSFESPAAESASAPVVPEPEPGIPISSPMAGIYYPAPSPGAEPFVKEGDTVQAGQIVGLIEAMKVFNEIPATVSGTVLRVLAKNGQVVAPGDPLMYVG